MEVNVKKTFFFLINGDEDDRQPLDVAGLVVEACQQCIHLGSPFTAVGSVNPAIRVHAHKKKVCAIRLSLHPLLIRIIKHLS